MDKSPFPIQTIVDYMAASRGDPRAPVVSEAFFLLEAIRRSGAPQPFVEQAKWIVRNMHSHAACLISIPDVEELHGVSSLCAKPEDGALLVLSDLSMCWFDATGQIGEVELVVEHDDLFYGRDFPAGIFAEVIALSPLHQTQYGITHDFFTGTDYEARAHLNEVILSLEDLLDPPVECIDDLASEENWTDEDVIALENLMVDIWLGLGVDFATETIIHSAVDHDHAGVEISAGHIDEAGREAALLASFELALRALCDLDDFRGCEFVPNDAPSDRMSGYDKAPQCVTRLEFYPESCDISNHGRISAPERLRTRLRDAGRDDAWIDAVLSGQTSGLTMETCE